MNLDISKTTHFLHHKTALNLNTKSVNPLIHLHSIHVKKKKIVVSIRIGVDWGYKLVPEGFGNCSFDLLAELSSDISSTKRNISLTFKKSTKKTATNNVTRSAYQEKCSFNT